MNSVLLDNGPLLTLLALEYLDKTGAGRQRADRVLGDIRESGPMNDLDRERFQRIVGRFDRRMTTPHVLAEAFKLREHSALKTDAWNFRRISLDTIKRTSILEITCTAADLSSKAQMTECVCQFGLADAVLLHLSATEGHVLLTDDKRLFGPQVQFLDFLLRSS